MVDNRLTMSTVQQLIVGLALVWVGGGLVFWSLYAPDAYKRGPMRAACLLLGTAIFAGGIVLANR